MHSPAAHDGRPVRRDARQLGGYFLIEPGDPDEAIGTAEWISIARVGTIDVRPLMEIEGLPAT